jgi:hypothetical protein
VIAIDGVRPYLAQHSAVAAAHDEDALGVGVRKEGQVRDHFLVGVLVALRELNHAVEDEDLAVGLGVKHQHVLELGPAFEQHGGLACKQA